MQRERHHVTTDIEMQADALLTSGRTAVRNGTHGEYSKEHLAMLAHSLTFRPQVKYSPLNRVRSEKSDHILRERCEGVLERLESYAAEYRNRLELQSMVVRHVLHALGEDDYEELAKLGIDISYAWLDDILRTATSGASVIGIETVGPYAANHLTADGLDIRAERLPADEQIGLLLAGIFRDVFADCENVRCVALIDDLTSYIPGRELTQEERDRYVVAIADIFRDFGAIKPDDRPGKNYIFIRESELPPAVDELVQRLRQSRAGDVDTLPNGDVIFYPSESFIERLALLSNNRRREFRRRGVLVKRQGRPTCHAMEAASHFHPASREMQHVMMLDRYFQSQQDKTYALVRAMEIVTQDRYHNLFYDSERLSPEVIVYVICELLAEQARRLLVSHDRESSWEQFDSDEYVTRNYGTRILPEDRTIINIVTDQLAQLNIPFKDAKLVADIGSGPNLYPAMILAPYLTDDGAIDLIEYSSSNRSYVQATIAQTPEERSGGIWNKFEELMIGTAGDQYLGCLERVCELGNSVLGSVFALPKSRYDIVSSYFVTESITSSRQEFWLATRNLATTVRPGGIIIAAHMVGSRGYQAGEGTHYPAVELSVEEIVQAYRDAGLTFSLSVVEQTMLKARDGYQKMMVVIAQHGNNK